jgi:hypothetical protein
MNATCSDMTETMTTPSSADAPTLPLERTDNFLYKAATVLAILLFLVSF